jgi:hypothetical protein
LNAAWSWVSAKTRLCFAWKKLSGLRVLTPEGQQQQQQQCKAQYKTQLSDVGRQQGGFQRCPS